MAVLQEPAVLRQRTSSNPNEPVELFAGYPDLLTPAHIAELTGLTVQYVRTLCRKNKLPAVQIGESRWYVPKPKFIEYVNGAYREGR